MVHVQNVWFQVIRNDWQVVFVVQPQTLYKIEDI